VGIPRIIGNSFRRFSQCKRKLFREKTRTTHSFFLRVHSFRMNKMGRCSVESLTSFWRRLTVFVNAYLKLSLRSLVFKVTGHGQEVEGALRDLPQLQLRDSWPKNLFRLGRTSSRGPETRESFPRNSSLKREAQYELIALLKF